MKIKLLISSFGLLFRRLLNFFPSALPVGLPEFERWAKDIIVTYDAPDNDSVRFALATMVLHLDSTRAKKSKRYFGLALHKGAANEIAVAIMNDLKAKQKAAIDAAKQAEATAQTAVSSNEAG